MLISAKLLSLLKTFSKHELNSFKKFVASPFHNEQQELIQLFAIIDHHFRASEKEQKANPLEKAMVWEYIFGTKPYNDVRMRRCLLYTSPSPRDRTRSRMPSSA